MRPFLIAVLIVVSVSTCFVNHASAQYGSRFRAPTKWFLDHEAGVFEPIPIANWRPVNLQFDYEVGTNLMVSNDTGGRTVRQVLARIESETAYKAIVREWEVLIVSKVDDERIQDLDAIVKDLNHADRDQAIDELLALSHPSIYPTLFRLMKNDTLENARKVSRALLSNHSVMMNYSPGFENAIEGFERAIQSDEWTHQSMAYNLPQPVLKHVDCGQLLNGQRLEYLERRVAQAKLTFADMKREYLTAPASPDSWPLCGTGYVHVLNHNDYANMIGDLRTDEAYAFLAAQAKELANDNNALNHEKLAELAGALAKSDSDDALDILKVIAGQQNLENSAALLENDNSFFANNSIADVLGTVAATGQSKYNPVIRLFCNSANINVRRTAFTILSSRNDPELYDVGIRGLEQIAGHAASVTDEDGRFVVEHSRFQAASILSTLSGPERERLQAYFLPRLDQPENAMEAAGYLSADPANQSAATLKKIIRLAGIPPEIAIRIRFALLDQKDNETIQHVLKRMEQRYGALHEAFHSANRNVMDHAKFNGWLAYIDSDIEKLRSFPESVERGIELMDVQNPPEQRMTGVIMVYTAARSLITDEVALRLKRFENDEDEWINKLVKAILIAR